MKVNIYIDGFNLYYGALKRTPYKWLDIAKLSQSYLPAGGIINTIKYFTARVSAWPHDPGQPARQDIYLRALKTIPQIQIIEGSFLVHPVRMPAATLNSQSQRVFVSLLGTTVRLPLARTHITQRPQMLWVTKTEEKGSDVNLAAHLINDGHNDDYNLALVISNDSDLLEPIRIVTKQLGLTVGIISPYTAGNQQLRRAATFVKHIRSGALRAAQLPDKLQDTTGIIRRPASW